jgi:hypothetical protein
MLIVRFFRRLRVAWSFLGLPNDLDRDTGRQAYIGPGLAWELAFVYHPDPSEGV